jgi:hypothetical protein
MHRLVWIHAGCKPIVLVLSWRGSYASSNFSFFKRDQPKVSNSQHAPLFSVPYGKTIAMKFKKEDLGKTSINSMGLIQL